MENKKKKVEVKNLLLSDITPNPRNPRKTFDADGIAELSRSIQENGLIQPITVRKTPKGSEFKYEIVCGERRYRASLLAGLESIEAVVKDIDDDKAYFCMVIENLQRQDVDPLEEASAINYLYRQGKYKVAEIAKLIGKSSSFVVSRIQLDAIIDEFGTLLRNKTLGIIHLLEICKLKKEQQKQLYASCFQPEHIERWPQKILKMEMLADLIDEYVMNTLDKAKFNPEDTTLTSCLKVSENGSCVGCKLCTATHPKRFTDTERARCMKRELFNAKNQEHVIRQAMNSGMQVVYVGTAEENETIINACVSAGVEITPIGNREYVLPPKAPNAETATDKDYYETRMLNFRIQNAVFRSNLEDGTIANVFEVSFHGNLSGESKYVYNTPVDANGNVADEYAVLLRNIENTKRNLYESMERERLATIEQKRQLLGNSDYSSNQEGLTSLENKLLLTLLVKRMGQQFRDSIGLDFATMRDINATMEKVSERGCPIIREFLKMSLSEESVCYSAELAYLMTELVQSIKPEESADVEEAVCKEYEAKRERYNAYLSEYNAKLHQAEQKQPDNI